MSQVKAEGYAPNDSRCDCEREGCNHRAGSCGREGFFIVRAYGIKQTLCAECFGSARRAAERFDEG